MKTDIDRINSALNSIYHCVVYYDNPPSTVLLALQGKLPLMEEEELKLGIEWGSVYLNGKRVVEKDVRLVAPFKLEYYQPKVPYPRLGASFPSFTKEWIIYEDQHLGIAFKPAGISTARAKEQQKYSMFDYLSDYYGCNVHLPSRLDFSTAGLMIYSLVPESHHAVQQLFSNREIDKKYLLKVDAKVDWQEKVVEANIGRSLAHPVLRRIKQEGGKIAKTIFTNFFDQYGAGVLEAKPITGRTHQIRVHAAEGLGLPIIGDNFYQGAVAEYLNLLSFSLQFKHPITHKILNIICPENLLPKWLGK